MKTNVICFMGSFCGLKGWIMRFLFFFFFFEEVDCGNGNFYRIHWKYFCRDQISFKKIFFYLFVNARKLIRIIAKN